MKVDFRVMRHIPQKLQANVVYADKFSNGNGTQNTYNVGFKFTGEPATEVGEDGFTDILADGIVGLKWAIKQVEKGRRGEIYG